MGSFRILLTSDLRNIPQKLSPPIPSVALFTHFYEHWNYRSAKWTIFC